MPEDKDAVLVETFIKKVDSSPDARGSSFVNFQYMSPVCVLLLFGGVGTEECFPLISFDIQRFMLYRRFL